LLAALCWLTLSIWNTERLQPFQTAAEMIGVSGSSGRPGTPKAIRHHCTVVGVDGYHKASINMIDLPVKNPSIERRTKIFYIYLETFLICCGLLVLPISYKTLALTEI